MLGPSPHHRPFQTQSSPQQPTIPVVQATVVGDAVSGPETNYVVKDGMMPVACLGVQGLGLI